MPVTPPPVEVAELVSEPSRWDGHAVTLTGEVVGDYGIRGEVVWAQVNDDPYVEAPIPAGGARRGGNVGIGVRFPREVYDESWGEPGGPSGRGPVLEISGVFHHNDPSEGGDTYVGAETARLVEPGAPFPPDPALPTTFLVAAALVIAALLAWPRQPRLRAD